MSRRDWLLVCALGFALFGCKRSGAPATPQEGADLQPQGAPGAPAPSFVDVAWPCCASTSGAVLLEHYLQLHKAIVAGDEAEVRRRTGVFAEFAGTASRDMAWSAGSRELAQRVQALLASKPEPDLEAARENMDDLSSLMTTLTMANRGGTTQVAVVWCPATQSTWLQDSNPIANPYTGPKEEGCGQYRR